MTAETMTCVCAGCQHELRADCINMRCACCTERDAEDMLTHGGG